MPTSRRMSMCSKKYSAFSMWQWTMIYSNLKVYLWTSSSSSWMCLVTKCMNTPMPTSWKMLMCSNKRSAMLV
eukprot:772556-Amphidinium_carterae.1